MLSGILPGTQRSSAVAVRYNEPLVVGSDASLSPPAPKKLRGHSNSGAERNFDTLGPRTTSSPMPDWSSASWTSNPGVSFVANDYDNGGNGLSALVSSFQVSRPSSRTNNNSNDGSAFGGFSPSTGIGGSDASGGGMAIGRAFDYDPANDYDNGNSLAALARSFQVSRPSSRANNYDGSVIGNLSPITGLGGSSAMGGGGWNGSDYGGGDQGHTSEYYSRLKVDSVRDAGVKDQPSSVLGSIASASRRRMKEIERYVHEQEGMSFPNPKRFSPRQGSAEGDNVGFDRRNYPDNYSRFPSERLSLVDQYSYDGREPGNIDQFDRDYDFYQTGDQMRFAP